ncbi:hypothetical protein OsJ_33517 [Oryza sativa Japonica Group]|uniref:Uncharacterized protein n=1 Tax=Oryza sativa subsp. japonica TaxID=39947 RepID=B9GA57_ORYSJ|nr:hypothetical protein OsJ_33517 [Oryza sativa Japonica Group]
MAASVGGARGGVRPAPRRRALRQSSPPPPPPALPSRKRWSSAAAAALAVEFAPPSLGGFDTLTWRMGRALVG